MLTTLKPFTDVRVRQAFKLAYNPSDVLQVAVHGFGTPAYNNPIAPDDSYRIKAHEGQDVDKAKFLLRQAGYSNGIDVTLYTSDSDPVLTPLALAYQASVKKAGIRANVSNQPSDSYFTKIWIQKPLCSSYWYSGPPADQLLNQVFRSGSSYNETKWKNVQFERLLDRARRETNYAKRRAIYQDVQTLLVAQSGTIIPFFADRLTGLSRKVRNYHEVGFEFDYLHLALAG
jgi:peptide/nickel transport system substrate-binding protein